MIRRKIAWNLKIWGKLTANIVGKSAV